MTKSTLNTRQTLCFTTTTHKSQNGHTNILFTLLNPTHSCWMVLIIFEIKNTSRRRSDITYIRCIRSDFLSKRTHNGWFIYDSVKIHFLWGFCWRSSCKRFLWLVATSKYSHWYDIFMWKVNVKHCTYLWKLPAMHLEHNIFMFISQNRLLNPI